MNIFDYVEHNGNYTFEEKNFNEIDNVIFSVLSYVNYNYVISINKKNKMTLSEAADIYFKIRNKNNDKKNILAIRQGIKLLNKVKDKPRFKDILIYSYKYIGNEESQFSAITFEINKRLCYVAFEGTDQLVSGWKEDCKMAYDFPVEAHRHAIKYLNNNFSFSNKRIIVGGHSKGGNLALVAAMYCNFLVRRKIINIYSNDGQGLRKAQIESSNYDKIKNIYIHIIPQNSIVGLLLRHTNDYVVIKSNSVGFLAHDAVTWQIENDTFKRDNLSKFSLVFEKGFTKWLDKYDDEKRKKFVNSVFKVLEENDIKSFVQLKMQISLIFKILKSSRDIDPIVKEMVVDLFNVLTDTNKEYKWIAKNE